MTIDQPPHELETDPRFPSGRWVGFFIQRFPPLGRQSMELLLSFHGGAVFGEGRDVVGAFVLQGDYDLADGKCRWTKSYIGRHDVLYRGFNEGKGIWGQWEITAKANRGIQLKGGFHIWPEGMTAPTQPVLEEQADLPLEVTLAV